MIAPRPTIVLDRRTLNRTLLARQGLLRRTAVPVPSMIEALVGLQAQVPRDPYVSLWSRIAEFDPASLERLLLERRAVRMTLMRATLHLVTAPDAVGLRAGTQPVVERAFGSSPFRRRLEGIDLDRLCADGVALVEERPRTTAELGAALAERWPGSDAQALAYAVRYLVPLVQVTPRGLLRRSAAPRVTTLAAWLGDIPASDPAPDDLVLRYLRAFGPASTADVRTWSGLADVRATVERLRPRLRSYRDASGRELFDVADGRLASPDEPAPPRFLGEYDNVFLSHADRSRITGDLAWGGAYARKGAFFVDGFLAGPWQLGRDGDRVTLVLEPHRPLSTSERAAAEEEAHGLGRLLGGEGAGADVCWATTAPHRLLLPRDR